METGHISKCLICYSDTISRLDSGFTNSFTVKSVQNHQSLISKHLDTIFTPKTVFGLTPTHLSEFLRSCPNIEDWIFICTKCEKQIDKCKLIYCEIQKITKKLYETKHNIVATVKSSFKINRSDTESRDANVLDITHKCRHYINKYNYTELSNPFIKGDAKAKELAVGLIIKRDACSPSSLSSQFSFATSTFITDHIIMKEEIEELDIGNKDEVLYDEVISDEDWKPTYIDFIDPCQSLDSEEEFDCARSEDTFAFDTLESESDIAQQNVPTKRKKPSKAKSRPKTPKKEGDRSENTECTVHGKVICSKSTLADHTAIVYGIGTCTREKKIYCKVIGRRKLLDGAAKNDPEHEASESETVIAYEKKSKSRKPPPKATCSICDKIFHDSSTLRRHKSRFHACRPLDTTHSNNKLGYKSPQFERSKKYKQHDCPLCPQKFNSWVNMIRHFNNKHKTTSQEEIDSRLDKYLKCTRCSFRGNIPKDLFRHKTRAHKEEDSEPIQCIPCEQCGVLFASQKLLKRHLSARHKPSPPSRFICDVCGNGFQVRGDLEKHKVRHTSHLIREHVCHVCGVDFPRKGDLVDHIQKFHSELAESKGKIFKCRYCDLTSPYNAVIRKHLQTHKEQTGNRCIKCGKCFINKQGLKRHVRINHNESGEQVPCPHCRKHFSSKEYMQAHVRKWCKLKDWKEQQMGDDDEAH